MNLLKSSIKEKAPGKELYSFVIFFGLVAAVASASMTSAGMAFFMVMTFSMMAAGSIWIEV